MKRLLYLLAVLGFWVAEARAAEMAYVIKVTSALAYLDVGGKAGVRNGDTYVILREKEGGYAEVGEVRVIRLDAAFSIAEISYVDAGEQMEVLQRAIAMDEWQAMSEPAEPTVEEALAGAGRMPAGCRSVHLVGGGEWNRETGLRWYDKTDPSNSLIMRPPKVENGMGLGVRLGRAVSRRWRLNLTYRIGLGGDVTAMGFEGDLHFAPGGCDRKGLYIGVGLGMQHMAWDAQGQDIDSTNKFGLNLMAGLQFPGRLGLLVETGYQRVLQWDDLIDVSNVRTFVGVGRSF